MRTEEIYLNTYPKILNCSPRQVHLTYDCEKKVSTVNIRSGDGTVFSHKNNTSVSVIIFD